MNIHEKNQKHVINNESQIFFLIYAESRNSSKFIKSNFSNSFFSS